MGFSRQFKPSFIPMHLEIGLADLISRGWVTCDSAAPLRQMITPPSRRKRRVQSMGRWSLLRAANQTETPTDSVIEMVARQLLLRTGVVFRATVRHERIPVNWSALSRGLRRMELRGEVRGGRFVAGYSGEQFASPQAIALL